MRLGGMSSDTGQDNKYLYNGKELEDDFDLNLYHYGARHYDPQLGRWIQFDPANEFNSPYVYCANNTVMFVDPDGNVMFSRIVIDENCRTIKVDNHIRMVIIDKTGTLKTDYLNRLALNSESHMTKQLTLVRKVNVEGKEYKVEMKTTAKVVVGDANTDKDVESGWTRVEILTEEEYHQRYKENTEKAGKNYYKNDKSFANSNMNGIDINAMKIKTTPEPVHQNVVTHEGGHQYLGWEDVYGEGTENRLMSGETIIANGGKIGTISNEELIQFISKQAHDKAKQSEFVVRTEGFLGFFLDLIRSTD